MDLQKLNKLNGDEREFERLKMLYPLFQFKKDGEHCVAILSDTHFQHFTIENGRVENDIERSLDHEHMEKSMSQALMKLYPDLYISVFAGRDGALASVWVKRDGRDAEAVGSVDVISKDLHQTLQRWQEEAGKAKRRGWFFCTGHKRAEPESDYGYFYFAGSYCKQWGNEHPEHRVKAARETYE